MQRQRITFRRLPQLKYLTHLDMMRLWERALRRAELPLVYSQGFTPRPHISLAAPLQVGMTSEGELMDVYLRRPISPFFFAKRVNPQLPRGVELLKVQEVSLGLPSLQSQLRTAEYLAEVEGDRAPQELQGAVDHLLSLPHLPWQHMRDTGPRHYDLRPLIQHIWLLPSPKGVRLGMRLTCSPEGSGRPEQVVAALSLPYPSSILRTRFILAGEGV